MTVRRQCEAALEGALEAGAEYADVRLVDSAWRAVRTLDQTLSGVDNGRNIGVGVRARVRGVWGFASGTDLDLSSFRQFGERAAQLAEAGGLLLTSPFRLAPADPIEGEWSTPVEIDPFSVPVADQVELLTTTERALRGAPAVSAMAGWIACSTQATTFANTEGSFIVQQRTVTGAGYQAFAEIDGATAVRSFPNADGYFGTGGFELIDALDLVGSAGRIRNEVSHLAYALPCPTTHFEHVILSGPTVAALLHETLGHALEIDRLGEADHRASGSFLVLDQLGQAQLASEHVNLTADPTLRTGLGTYAYDDEGVPARSVQLLDRGLWVGCLSDRATAGALGLDASSGCARASGFNRAPMLRMSNINLEPGTWSLDDLIANTERGLLIDTPIAFWVDPQHRRFRCDAEAGWLIDGGRLREMVRAPSFDGETTAFWRSCDAVCDADAYALWGVTRCSRGVPRQTISTGHGAAPARFAGHLVTSRHQG